MILPVLPQSGPLAMPDTPTLEDRSGEGGFALLWAMEKPVEKPAPAIENLPSAQEPDLPADELGVDNVMPVPANKAAPDDRALRAEKAGLDGRAATISSEAGPTARKRVTAEHSLVAMARPEQSASALLTLNAVPVPTKTGADAKVSAPAIFLQGTDKLAVGNPAVTPLAGAFQFAQPNAQATVAQFYTPQGAAALPDDVPPAITPAAIVPTTHAAGQTDNAAPVLPTSQATPSQPLTKAARPAQSAIATTGQPSVTVSEGQTVRDAGQSGPVAESTEPARPTAQADHSRPVPPVNAVPIGQGGYIPLLETLAGEASQSDVNLKDDTGLLPSHPASQSGPTAATSFTAYQTMRPTAPTVTHQLLDAFVRSEGGRTEIALNPEELGRVRFAMVATDAGMTLAITTERPETADLIRRNLEDLAREFRQMGFENLTFSFDDAPQDGGSDNAPRNQPQGLATDNAPDMADPATLQRLRTGLDLKL